jgi:hypothetical protein
MYKISISLSKNVIKFMLLLYSNIMIFLITELQHVHHFFLSIVFGSTNCTNLVTHD